VIRNEKVVEHRVPPGAAVGDWVEVPSDKIRPGDAVAITNLGMLVEGGAVRVSAPAGKG